ncbi:MAG: GntR family transcriptional regulator [Lentisphaeria bacterium]|nr:GntR family transcriptional regulator [Lentisphaeria bacterium]
MMKKIQESNDIKYRRIAGILRERIRRGIYRVGDKLPSYPQLCELFEVSDMTIRQAVALLANEGLLRRERGRGKGVYVNPPPPPEESVPALRRLCILPAAPSLRSDDPAIQQGAVQAVNAAEASLVLMPALSGAARRSYLKHLIDNAGIDGFLINGQIFASGDEAFEIVDYFDAKRVRYLLIFSAEDACSRDFLRRRHPGVYIDEQPALLSALTAAAAKKRTRLLFAGVDRYSVERSLAVARNTPGSAGFTLEPMLFDELAAKSLFREFETRLLPALDAHTTLVLEGSNLPLSYFDALLNAKGLKPGRDVSVLYFEHYCNLDPLFGARYSSVTRPYAELGRAAGLMLERMVLEDAPGEVLRIPAEFNDQRTI